MEGSACYRLHCAVPVDPDGPTPLERRTAQGTAWVHRPEGYPTGLTRCTRKCQLLAAGRHGCCSWLSFCPDRPGPRVADRTNSVRTTAMTPPSPHRAPHRLRLARRHRGTIGPRERGPHPRERPRRADERRGRCGTRGGTPARRDSYVLGPGLRHRAVGLSEPQDRGQTRRGPGRHRPGTEPRSTTSPSCAAGCRSGRGASRPPAHRATERTGPS